MFADRDGSSRVFTLPAGPQPASVGRGPSADLRLDWDDQVSRAHARFEPAGEEWEVVDDGFSSNGTFVNEERLNGRRRLKHGDRVRFGATTVTFRSPQPQPAAPAPAPVSLSTTQRRVLAALCRPARARVSSARPATDQEIADELILSVGEVRTHLRVLYAKLGIDGPPDEQTRLDLVERAFSMGLVSERDL